MNSPLIEIIEDAANNVDNPQKTLNDENDIQMSNKNNENSSNNQPISNPQKTINDENDIKMTNKNNENSSNIQSISNQTVNNTTTNVNNLNNMNNMNNMNNINNMNNLNNINNMNNMNNLNNINNMNNMNTLNVNPMNNQSIFNRNLNINNKAQSVPPPPPPQPKSSVQPFHFFMPKNDTPLPSLSPPIHNNNNTDLNNLAQQQQPSSHLYTQFGGGSGTLPNMQQILAGMYIFNFQSIFIQFSMNIHCIYIYIIFSSKYTSKIYGI